MHSQSNLDVGEDDREFGRIPRVIGWEGISTSESMNSPAVIRAKSLSRACEKVESA
jgi:hypothetical protein